MVLSYIILSVLTALVITLLTIPSIIRVAKEKHLYDEPNEYRKSHNSSIPTLGGIAIFGGTLISTTLFVNFYNIPEFTYALPAIIILFFTGVKDDIIPLTPIKKLVAQLLASLIIVVKCDVRLTHLYGFLEFDDISYEWSIILSVFTMLVIINSFNLIDGINGLAGGVGVIVSFTFGCLFYNMGKYDLVIVAAALIGALLGFLRYNLSLRAKIFMGDTGSLLIGIILAIFSIQFIELNREMQAPFAASFAPVFTFAILIIPLFDTLRVFILRVSIGKHPFSADRNHLHHLLIDLGMPHWQASVILYSINILFIAMTILFKDVSQLPLLLAILATASLLSVILTQMKLRRQLILEQEEIKVNAAAANKYLKSEFSSK